MTGQRLRYSDRHKLAETGSLGDLDHDRVPDELGVSVRVMIESADERWQKAFVTRLQNELIEHFGEGRQWFGFFSGSRGVEDFLDAVEILAEQAKAAISVPRAGDPSGRRRVPVYVLPDVENRINRAFERFRFGYRIEDGAVHRIGSPALDEAVIGPTLLAVRRDGWEEVERTFREALDHQRGSETDDALTAASAAVEAALKAIGMKGNTLKDLARSFKGSGQVPGYLSNVPELLEDLLDRLHAARSTHGDAHGSAPGAEPVPQPLADLGIYWAGAFIAYLADTIPSEAEARPTEA